MHNGTVWRWNRACYGVADGIAHLRIENRALPSGPTVQDEMANAAFFVGLMVALPYEYGAIAKRLSFDDAKGNFFAAARHGLNAQLRWLDGKSLSATFLILNELLPLARAGLKQSKVDSIDIDKYLGVLEERVRSGQTGAQWMLASLTALNGSDPVDMLTRTLTAAILARQKEGKPVHEWKLAEAGELDDWSQSYQTVGQFMSTDLFTLRPNDLVDLAASLMEWRHIRHVPVEDENGRLVGLVTHRGLHFTADTQVIVQRQNHDRRVARVAPLRATTILHQPVRNRLDQLVLRIDREERAQNKRRRLDTTFRPAPVNTVFAPVRGSHH